jgi:hypothetical protein
MRDVAIGDRSLEAHYGRFVLSQARKGVEESRIALNVSYGATRARRRSPDTSPGSTSSEPSRNPTTSMGACRRSSRGTTARCSS